MNSPSPGTVAQTPPIPSIAIRIGQLSITGFVITVLIFLFSPRTRDFLRFAVPAAGVAGGVTGAFYIGAGLRQNIDHKNISGKLVRELKEDLENTQRQLQEIQRTQQAFLKNYELIKKQDRALAYITAWNNPQFAEFRGTAYEIHKAIEHKSTSQQYDTIRDFFNNNPVKEQHIVTLLNFLEQVATTMKQELSDTEVLSDYFAFIIPRVYEIFGEWILGRRREGNGASSLYESIEHLAKEWNSNGTRGS